MMRNPKNNSLDRFQYQPDESKTDILITCCPKTVFSVHPDPNRVVENVLVTYRHNRWHLVDGELYRHYVHVEGLLRADIYDCVDIDGNRFLLISTYPLSGDMTTWRESVLDVVDSARIDWVKMKKMGNGYEAEIIADIRYAPRWSKRTMGDFVLEAFGGNVITAENWPVAPLSSYELGLRNSRNRQGFIQERV